MSDKPELKCCPMCRNPSEYDYGGEMDSGKRIVKVKCRYGCVAQMIFYCDEESAAASWNNRSAAPETVHPVYTATGVDLNFVGASIGIERHVFGETDEAYRLRVISELVRSGQS